MAALTQLIDGTITVAKEIGGHVVEAGDAKDGAWWLELGKKQGMLQMRVDRLQRSMRLAGQEYTVVVNGDAMSATDALSVGTATVDVT